MRALDSAAVEAAVAVTRPFAAEPLLAYLGVRAMPGTEEVEGLVYRRAIVGPAGAGVGVLTVDLSNAAATGRVRTSCMPALGHTPQSLTALVTRLLDADAPVDAIAAVLERDRLLLPLVADTPGMRIPGAVGPFELAVRAVLGQQVSVAAASTFAGKIAREWGLPLQQPAGMLRRAFPGPDRLAEAPLEDLGVARGRAAAIRHLACSVQAGRMQLQPGGGERAEAALLEVPGIGPWTASYIGLRGLGNRDAIPTSDLGLRQVLGNGTPWTPSQVTERSAPWRPWRGYAASYLWSTFLS
jgi:AraC family transcriptional regulator, regulatory protein of adaptative response / DNA-3-methyladenine glycosylase II